MIKEEKLQDLQKRLAYCYGEDSAEYKEIMHLLGIIDELAGNYYRMNYSIRGLKNQNVATCNRLINSAKNIKETFQATREANRKGTARKS